MMLHFFFFFFCNKFRFVSESVPLKQKSSHLLTITELGIKAVAAGQTLPFKLGLSKETPSVISRYSILYFNIKFQFKDPPPRLCIWKGLIPASSPMVYDTNEFHISGMNFSLIPKL